MIISKCFIPILFLFWAASLNAQRGFKTSLALDPGEPNAAFQVEEFENKYYLSGVYFDKDVDYWLAYLGIYDNQGNFIKRHGITNDTSFSLNISEQAVVNNQTYTVMGNSGITALLEYNFDLDTFKIVKRIDVFAYDFGPLCFLKSLENDNLFYCGRDRRTDKSQAAVMKVSDNVVSFFNYTIPEKSQYARNMRFNSEGNIVTVVESDDSWNDTTYVIILDQQLNLITNTSRTPLATNFSFGAGMTIDNEDNIICTGARVTKPDDAFEIKMGAIKFDKNGKEIWTASIADHSMVVDDYGEWNAIIHSNSNDGYVLAGARSYQTENKDTSMLLAALGKLSPEGDSLWHYTYSFRTDVDIEETFNDVIATNDGGYLAVGRSSRYTADSLYLPWVQSIIIKVNADGLLDTTGVSTVDLDHELDINIYPNPTSGRLYLRQQKNETLDIEIFNDSGQLVEKHFSDSSHHTAIVDLQGYPPGLYTIIARSRSGASYTNRIVLVDD